MSLETQGDLSVFWPDFFLLQGSQLPVDLVGGMGISSLTALPLTAIDSPLFFALSFRFSGSMFGVSCYCLFL